MRVLVAGASGFLGRALVPRLLGSGHEVTGLGRLGAPPFIDSVPWISVDLTSSPAAAAHLTPWRWDAVVNLAGPVTGGSEDWSTGTSVVTAHVRIAMNLRGFVTPATRIVHASSMTVYGMPSSTPITEQHARSPRHLYGLAKVLSEDVWLAPPPLDVWVLRLPGLFSEQRRTGALFHFCRNARAGRPIHVTAVEPTPWDVLHVDDAAAAIEAALTASSRAGGALNVGYGEPVELVAMAGRIAQLAGTGAVVDHPRDVTHPVVCHDVTAMHRLLGWEPTRLQVRLESLLRAAGDAS